MSEKVYPVKADWAKGAWIDDAKYQELSLNPQKLAGQCSKLKCCLNFEFDCYIDAQRSFPSRDIFAYSILSAAYSFSF